MTQLKTLKDLEKEEYNNIRSWGIPQSKIKKGMIRVDSLKLRQEAIKWINELDKESYYKSDDAELRIIDGLETERSSQHRVINWIKYFFNITEEELR